MHGTVKILVLLGVAVGDAIAMAIIAPRLVRAGNAATVPIIGAGLVSGLAILAYVLFGVLD